MACLLLCNETLTLGLEIATRQEQKVNALLVVANTVSEIFTPAS